MTTYLPHPATAVRSRPVRESLSDRHKNGLAALVAGTALTAAVLSIAAAPASDSTRATAASGPTNTIESQVGTVTAVTPTSITVRSADGLSKTYRVNTGTAVDCRHNGVTSVAVGDPVAVTASVAAGTATATDIADPGANAPVITRILLRASPLAPSFESCLSHSGAFSAA